VLEALPLQGEVQRHFRQKARQVVVFHCERGLLAGIQPVISHPRLAAVAMPWQRLLEEVILAV